MSDQMAIIGMDASEFLALEHIHTVQHSTGWRSFVATEGAIKHSYENECE